MVNQEQPAPKPTYASCITSYQGETKIKVTEYKYTWIISNFANCYLKNGQYVTSPTFVAFHNNVEYGWTMKLYPKGQNNSQLTSSIQLSPLTNDEVEIFLKINLIDSNGKLVNLDFENHVQLFNPTPIFPLSNNDLKMYLVNQDLIVLIKMYFNGVNDVCDPNPKESMDIISMPEHRLLEFDDFENLLENGRFSDLALIVRGQKFQVHKNILSARSPVFSAMFEHDMRENNENELDIPDVEPAVMKEILRYIYAGKVENIDKMDSDLFLAANKYGIIRLRDACEMTFIYNLSIDNVSSVLALVDLCDESNKLLDGVLDFVTNNSKILKTNENFMKSMNKLSPSLLAKVVDKMMSKL